MSPLSIVAYYLLHNEVVGIADASVGKKQGCHVYILETTNETYRICGEAPVDVDPDVMRSNRAEACGVQAMGTLATQLAKFFDTSNSVFHIYCNNDKALRHNDTT